MAVRPVNNPARQRGGYSNLSGTLNAAPDFLSRLNAALRRAGVSGLIGDPLGGYRTGAQEDYLNRTEGGKELVGTSSTSMHVQGWASDVTVGGRPIRDVVSDKILAAYNLIAPYGNDRVHVEDRRGLTWAKAHPYHPGGDPAAGAAWQSCTLTWYDPALGGTNSSSGRADPHSATSSGEPYNPNAFTCAAPGAYPFGTKLMFRFRNRTVTCRVTDRGGAISGSHFDLSRAAANALGIINAGKVSAEFTQVGGGAAAGSGGSGVTRPGGTEPDSSGAGLEALYQAFLTEGKQGDTAFASFASSSGKAKTRMVGLFPGLGPIPDVPGLPSFDPFDLFKQGMDAIKTTQDLLKLIGWIFNPRNMLRVVEFLVGVSLLYIAVRVNLQVFADAASEKATRLFGGKRGKGKRGRQGRTGGGGRTRELAYESGKRRIAARSGPGQKPKPNAKQLGSGGAKAAGKGKLASAASKTKTVIKLAAK